MEKSNELNESLKRHRELLGYNTKTGGRSLTERNHMPYLADEPNPTNDSYTDYADDEEADKKDTGGEDTEGGDNVDFDFGDDSKQTN